MKNNIYKMEYHNSSNKYGQLFYTNKTHMYKILLSTYNNGWVIDDLYIIKFRLDYFIRSIKANVIAILSDDWNV